MKTLKKSKYFICLKSYTSTPDFEDWTEAYSKKEAVEYWYRLLGKYGWTKEILKENIIKESEMRGYEEKRDKT